MNKIKEHIVQVNGCEDCNCKEICKFTEQFEEQINHLRQMVEDIKNPVKITYSCQYYNQKSTIVARESYTFHDC